MHAVFENSFEALVVKVELDKHDRWNLLVNLLRFVDKLSCVDMLRWVKWNAKRESNRIDYV